MKDWELTEEKFILNTPQLYRPWYNYLSNPDYGLKISHLGDGYATTIKEPRIAVTNYDFFMPSKGRFIYVNDGTDIWSPAFYPARTRLDKYQCVHAPGYTQFISSKNGIQAEYTLFLPVSGTYEIGLVKITNQSKTGKNLSFFPECELLLYNSFAIDPVYYSWYTDSKYRDDLNSILFFKMHGDKTIGFFSSVTKPDGFDSSLPQFLGNGDIFLPEGVVKRNMKSTVSGGDPYAGVFMFNLDLKPGQEASYAFFTGVGEDTLRKIRSGYREVRDVEGEFERVRQTWKKRCDRPAFAGLKDGTFKNYIRTFFPYQIYQQSQGLVRSTYRGFRDVAQDSMGLGYFEPESAREILVTMASRQYKNGRCLRQWNTGGGYNDERDFRDLPLWMPVAIAKYMETTKDKSVVDAAAPYLDSPEGGSMLEHMLAGIRYVLQFGSHKLIEAGIGDWNDALSGLGPKGGSVWLNQFAYYALEKYRWICAQCGAQPGIDIDALQDKLYEGILPYWTGEWFARGVTEDGTVVGGPERIFILPQAWFVISGMHLRDKAGAETALRSMVNRLDNEYGLLKCSPGFDKYDKTVGNLSALTPGMAENYAVYNHAAAFAVYGLLKFGWTREAVVYLNKLLPMNKDYSRTRSEPFVLVNYYNGGYHEHKKGQGGIPWLTSTVSWIALIMFEEILPKGIVVD
jgi:cellobiose phosphorylase